MESDATQRQIVRDLAHKASDDTQAAIRRAWQFARSPFDMMEMATMSSACALAYAAASMNAHLGAGHSAEEVTDALWQLLRPMVLKTLGGSDADFKALLAQVEAASHD